MLLADIKVLFVPQFFVGFAFVVAIFRVARNAIGLLAFSFGPFDVGRELVGNPLVFLG